MTKKFLLGFLLLALAIASAKTYTVSFHQAVTVAGTELKAGDYRLEMTGDKVTISNGKQSVESPVKVEQAESKFGSTSARISNASGKMLVDEIDLGGTKTKLVFNN